MTPKIDHIQITVKDLALAEGFYDLFLPELGFDLARNLKGRVAEHDFDVVEYVHENFTIGINSPRESEQAMEVHRRRPGSIHHLAFAAKSKKEVLIVHEKLEAVGVKPLEAPKYYPQHGEKYFAVFYKDPGGIKLEIMFEAE